MITVTICITTITGAIHAPEQQLQSSSAPINGEGGNDKIQINENSDKIYGDAGNDILQGGIESDQIFGRTDNDVG